jgi:hypothetical protein
VQLASERSRHSNCCVSLVYPNIRARAIKVAPNGSATIRWRIPTVFAQCVRNNCTSPDFKRFRRGEHVAVDVFASDDSAYAESRARIT